MRPALVRHNLTLKKLVDNFLIQDGISEYINPPFIRFLCSQAENLFECETNVLDLIGPINVCGDIHGNYSDLISIFKLGGHPSQFKYLFLGDYVDRGDKSVEVVTLLFALKISFPNNIYLIRGNHETKEMTKIHGFAQECKKKLEKGFCKNFTHAFNRLPLSAVINKCVFCIHGGISPHLKTMSDIDGIHRIGEIPETGLFSDLLWSDPSPLTEEYSPSERGNTVVFGLKPTKEFLESNSLSMIVRGHQSAQNGYDYPFVPDTSVLTIFSTSSTDHESPNSAAFVRFFNQGCGHTIQELPTRPSSKKKVARIENFSRKRIGFRNKTLIPT